MEQVFNIFRKDLRRFWREIAMALALLAMYSWNDVRGWMGDQALVAQAGFASFFSYRFLSGLVVALLPVAWAFMIARVIQGESLVGDRQFWITRPYEWKKLLTAKVLFVFVTINVPLLIADFILLAKAGFAPTHYMAGLLTMQLLMLLILVMPIVTLATVTGTVVQMIFAILAVILGLIGIAALASAIPSSSFSGPTDQLELILLVATCATVVLRQYAQRKTVRSRCLIGALGFIVALMVAVTPYNAIVNREFPRLESGGQLPVQFTLLPADPRNAAEGPRNDKEVTVQLPLSASGIAEDSIVVLSGVKVALEAPDGWRWNSGWFSPGNSLFPDQKNTEVSFGLKRSLFELMKSSPVKARIFLALTEYRDENRRNFVTPGGEFRMPGVGICNANVSYLREIHCRAPLRTPSSMLITSDLSATTCPAREGESRAETKEIARDWHQHSDSLAEFGISPVKSFDIYMWDRNERARHMTAGICPGTPLVLSNPEIVRRLSTELEINDLRLVDYRLREIDFGGGAVGIDIR